MNKEYLSVKELADFLGVAIRTVYNQWPKWVREYGIRAIRINGNGNSTPRFNKKDAEKMRKAWEVIV